MVDPSTVSYLLPSSVDPFSLLAATLSSTYSINRSGNSVKAVTICRALVGLRWPVYVGDSANWGEPLSVIMKW